MRNSTKHNLLSSFPFIWFIKKRIPNQLGSEVKQIGFVYEACLHVIHLHYYFEMCNCTCGIYLQGCEDT